MQIILIAATIIILLTSFSVVNAEQPGVNNDQQTLVADGVTNNKERYRHYLQYLLEHYPTSTRPRILLGRFHLEQGNLAEAEREFESARQMGADPHEILPLLGNVLLAQGNAHEVLNLKLPNPTSASLRARMALLYGQAQLILAQLDAAAASFTAALKLEGVRGAAYVGLAWVALARHDFDQAEAAVTRAFSAHDGQTEAWLVKAEILRLREQPDAAGDAFAKVLALNPRHLTARLGKAAMELAQHHTAAATDDLNIAAQLAPAHPLLNRLRALLTTTRDDHAHVDHLLEQNASSLATITLLSNVISHEMQAGRHQAVLLTARRLQQQAPHLALGYAAEGAIRMAQQDWDSAIHVLEAAYQREPNGWFALDIYNARRHRGENYPETTLENWFAQYPYDLNTRLMAAIAAQQNGQFAMAQNYYKKILAIQPTHLAALNNLAWLYLEQRDPHAMILATQAYQIAPNNQQVIDTYKKVLANINNVKSNESTN